MTPMKRWSIGVKGWLIGLRVVEREDGYLAVRLPQWLNNPTAKRDIAAKLTKHALAAGKQVRIQVDDGPIVRCWRLDAPENAPQPGWACQGCGHPLTLHGRCAGGSVTGCQHCDCQRAVVSGHA
jgi:hypothetical protein